MFFTPYGVLVGEYAGEEEHYYDIKDILAFILNPKTQKPGFTPLIPDWKEGQIYQMPKGTFMKLKEVSENLTALWDKSWTEIRAARSNLVLPTKADRDAIGG